MTRSSSPARFEIDLGDGTLAGLRWPETGAPPLLFCHATGFCASVYKQMLARLSGDYDVVALDMRGHGLTRLPADPDRLRSWRIYRNDVSAFLDRERRQGWTLAGHSMGAIVALLAADGREDVSALRLIEPVLSPAWMMTIAMTPLWPPMARRLPFIAQARRRRNQWPSREAAAESYGRKAVFSGWADGVLGDYLEDGLRAEDDAFVLSCAPAWEAATFAAQANPSWAALAASRKLGIEIFLADHASSTVDPRARRRLARLGIRLTGGVGVGHLAPMERPDVCAAFIAGTAKPQAV